MLRMTGTGLMAALLSTSAFAQSPSALRGDLYGYGGLLYAVNTGGSDAQFYLGGGGARINVPFGTSGNFEIEARFDLIGVLSPPIHFVNGEVLAHLYLRDPAHYALGLFGGVLKYGLDGYQAWGGEAQVYVGRSVFYGQGLYASCLGCARTHMVARGEAVLFPSPANSLAGDVIFSRSTAPGEYTDNLSTIFTVTHQFNDSRVALFGQAQYNHTFYSLAPGEQTNSFGFAAGIRVLLGPAGETLQDSILYGPAMNTVVPISVVVLSCFVGDTEVLMADGTRRRIDAVRVGDLVMGGNGEANRVVEVETPLLGDRKLYAFDDGNPFVTAEHPFMTRQGWKAIDPAATLEENGLLNVGALTAADEVVRLASVIATARPMRAAGGARYADPVIDVEIATAFAALRTITAHEADPTTPVFNLRLDGDNTYFANDYLVHNK